jgi:hypothetical protein
MTPSSSNSRKGSILRDESVGWNVNIGYTVDGIGEITILDAQKSGIYPLQIERVVDNATRGHFDFREDIRMKAIEIEATVEKHCIRLPDAIPDGTHLRVLLLMDEASAVDGGDLKQILAGLTEGLTDEDLRRPRDFGRGDTEWDS